MSYPYNGTQRSGAVPGILMLAVILFVLNLVFGWVAIPWPDWNVSSDHTVSADEKELRAALIERHERELARADEYIETAWNSSPAIDKLREGKYKPQPWCAIYVTAITSWVYQDLGLDPPFSGGETYGNLSTYILPRVMNDPGQNDVVDLVGWAKDNDRYYTRSDIRNGSHSLQLGDFVVFDQSNRRGSNHTGAVIAIDGNTITTAEGNASDRLLKNTYTNYLDVSDINGFVDVGFK